MPIAFQFSGHTICITLSGQYSLKEGRQTYSAILADPSYKEGMNLLFDARQSDVNPSITEVKERVAFLKSVIHHSSGRVAVVVSDPLRYGLVRMLSVYAEMSGMNVTAFWDMEKASRWLEAGLSWHSEED